MKLKQKLTAIALGSLLLAGGGANAAFLQIVGGAAGLQSHTVDVAEELKPWGVPSTAGGWPQDTPGYLRGYLKLGVWAAEGKILMRKCVGFVEISA